MGCNGLRTVLAATLVLAGCATVAVGPGFYDASPVDDPVQGRCTRTREYGNWVFREHDRVSAYFRPDDIAAYRQAIAPRFSLPERPLIRVTVFDHYRMINGPTYRESEISVLVLHERQLRWLILTLPVTDSDACESGRRTFGFPKVMRHITLEGGNSRYVGTLYAPGGREPEFVLTVDVGEPGEGAREILRFDHGFPYLTVKDGRVMKFPRAGFRDVLPAPPVYELERQGPGVQKLRLGKARLDFSREDKSLLHRLRVGEPLAGFWARMHLEFSVKPQ